MFRFINADDFPPFGKFEIHFPAVENKPAALAEVHLLTGINGTGKTRILSLLAALLGYQEPLKKRIDTSKQHIFRIADTLASLRAPNHAQTGITLHTVVRADFSSAIRLPNGLTEYPPSHIAALPTWVTQQSRPWPMCPHRIGRRV